MADGLFEGLKVIDCASYIAAPAAATVMSDFGAEVIKIEPLTGDLYRNRTLQPKVVRAPDNPHWIMDSRNKKSLPIDITTESGYATLCRIIAGADVFITNFPPKVRQKLRLRYTDLASLNPRLIYASFTGFGESGPDSDKPGFDATVWWARSGMMDTVRWGDNAPVRVPAGMGDHSSAMGFYSAIVSALYRRERTGQGSHVGSSLLMNGIWANSCLIQTAIYGEEIARPDEREEDPMPWRNSYRCSDGKWLLLSIVHSDLRWNVFKTVAASPLLDDSRFQTVADRKKHPVELTAALDRIFATRTAAEWTDILDRHGVVFGAVTRVIDVPDDKQARLTGAIVPTEDGMGLTISSPFWIEGVDKTKAKRAPTLGQHTDEVLLAAGLSDDEIQTLRNQGVVN